MMSKYQRQPQGIKIHR